jgi:hypothetical protein
VEDGLDRVAGHVEGQGLVLVLVKASRLNDDGVRAQLLIRVVKTSTIEFMNDP